MKVNKLNKVFVALSIVLFIAVSLFSYNWYIQNKSIKHLEYKLNSAIEMRNDLITSESILEFVVDKQSQYSNKIEKENIEFKKQLEVK